MSEIDNLVKDWNELGEEYKSLEVIKRNISEYLNSVKFQQHFPHTEHKSNLFGVTG